MTEIKPAEEKSEEAKVEGNPDMKAIKQRWKQFGEKSKTCWVSAAGKGLVSAEKVSDFLECMKQRG